MQIAKPLFDIISNVHRIQSKEILCDYLHRAAGYPVKKTWLQAIKDGFFTSWRGLTFALVLKFLPETSEEIAAGHLHRRRQGIQSTRVSVIERMNTIEMLNPELSGQGKLHHNRQQRVGVHLVANDELIIELNGTIPTNQTGRFSIISQKVNSYTMVLYNYDSNAILAEGCRSRTATDLETAYDKFYIQLTKAGIVLVMQRIDNEVSKIFIESIASKGLKYQLASPHDHRMNPAERAVQTWKNHFISNLHSEFTAYKWCEIMHQCEMTLNMLRRSRINPKMSAYTQLFGSFNYNRTPLAPLGTKAFVHERRGQRRSHADHGKV